MHMEDNGKPCRFQAFNRLCQTITGNSLHNVLCQFPAVGLYLFPLLRCLVHTPVRDRLTAKPVRSDLRIDVKELPAGR